MATSSTEISEQSFEQVGALFTDVNRTDGRAARIQSASIVTASFGRSASTRERSSFLSEEKSGTARVVVVMSFGSGVRSDPDLVERRLP